MARPDINFSEAITELDVLDLSTVEKSYSDISPIKQIQDHMKKEFLSVTEIKKVISCGPLKEGDRISTLLPRINLNRIFPVWILLSLIPEDKEMCLTVGEIMVSTYFCDQVIPELVKEYGKTCNVFGKGCLKIERLIVVVCPKSLKYINGMRNELLQYGISYITCKLKLDITYFDDECSRQLRRLRIEPGDEFTFFHTGNNLYDLTRIKDEDAIPYISPLIEDLDIPCTKEISKSPHTMFGDYSVDPYRNNSSRTIFLLSLFPKRVSDGILIATLGHGYEFTRYNYMFDKRPPLPVIDVKNFASKTAPVSHKELSFPWEINKIAPNSDLILCQTTYSDGTIVNGATAKAINWLRDKWSETWKKKYDNLVILIPYGGQYMEDEMIAVYKATDEGINIVCAAGEGGKVIFPAALGNVISVGVANDIPKGREIDVSMKSYDNILVNMYNTGDRPDNMYDCGIAAAEVIGLLSVLLSRINSLIKPSSKLTSPLSKEIAASIKRVRGYTHTCVIRELLINEGDGFHSCHRGYGIGNNLFLKLAECDDDHLLTKMANILLKKHPGPEKGTKNKHPEIIPISDEMRDILYHGLTGKNISVAVIDSDFPVPKPVSEEEPVSKKEREFHGEICANIVTNVCPKAKVLPIKDHGSISPGVKECCKFEKHVSIISCSMGTDSFNFGLCKTVSEAIMAGKILVFSAGNEGQRLRNTISYPGRIGNVLVIGGRDPFNNPLNFSSVGRELDFLAPGELGRTVKGTSYAAPVIAGYIALLLEFIKRMSEEGYKITVWSMNPDSKEYEWRNISIWKAAHNVYTMRTLLKILVPKPQKHSETMGFGCVDLSTLFPSYRTRKDVKTLVSSVAKDKLHRTLQHFYCKS